MGERSQIFIRYRVKKTEIAKKYDTEGFIAVHHQWSYGDRMISRCRGIIEQLVDMGQFPFKFNDKEELNILRQVINTNWDMRSIISSCDLVKEELEWVAQDNNHKINVFETDSNHGHIYIDIDVVSGCEEKVVIKYAFCEYYNKPVKSVLDFANWDMGNHNEWREKGEALRNWDKPSKMRCRSDEAKSAFKEIVKYTRDNMKFINENATLMTEKEKNDFVKWGNKYVNGLAKKMK